MTKELENTEQDQSKAAVTFAVRRAGANTSSKEVVGWI